MNRILLLLAVTLAARSAVLAADCCAKAGHPSCCAEVQTAPTSVTEKSLYQLDSTWTNDNGAAINLTSLKGRPQVVAMFFANCAYTCPLLVHNMKQIEAALPENLRTNVGFVLVSFDSERDTPAALHDYRVQHQLDSRGWTLLHGNPDDILEFAALLGVKFKKDAQGQFMHSNVITFLNSEGEIAFQETGLNVSPADVVDKLVREGDRSH
jgi:protein SCO1/2